MNTAQLLRRASRLAAAHRVTRGSGFRLSEIDPASTHDLEPEQRDEARELLETGARVLGELQEVLYAQNRWAVLVILQGLDASGKDGAIEHVMSGVDPQGCQVFSFKVPSHEELDHDYLWRCHRALPERGRIGIFNRSYYEEVLVVRVHPELLGPQHLPAELVGPTIWDDRLEEIAAFERYLARNGVAVCKFFLHVSKEEQRRRLLARMEEPRKQWKFSLRDLEERAFRRDYLRAYEAAIRRTATVHAPWYVVPADHKWFARLVVAAGILETLDGLKLRFPEPDAALRRDLARGRRLLNFGDSNRNSARTRKRSEA